MHELIRKKINLLKIVCEDDIARVMTLEEECSIIDELCKEYEDSFKSISLTVASYGFLVLLIKVAHIKEALPLLRSLRKKGIKQHRFADDPDRNERSYYYNNLRIDVRLSENASCSFVEVGKKKVIREVPKYELRCNGGPYIEEEENDTTNINRE